MTTPIQIDLIYEATTPLPGGITLPTLMAAYQTQITRDFAPIWNAPATLDIQTASRAGVWRAIFLDDADQADALGYHELTPDGLPQAKIFVRTTLEDKENPTVTGSHELMEMLADPKVDQVAKRNWLRTYAKEVCDAVEETTYEIAGLAMSNFQFPSWFGERNPVGHSGPPYDFLNKTTGPWQLLKGGYMPVQEPDGQWTQIFGSVHAASRFSAARKWRPQARESGIMRRSTR